MSSLKVFPPCSRDSEALSFSSLTGYTISVSPATANSQLRLITRICRQGASWQTIRRSQPQPFPASACRLFPKRIFSTLASECKCGSQISFQKAFVKLLVTLLNERKHTHRVWQRRRRRQVGGHRPAQAECNPWRIFRLSPTQPKQHRAACCLLARLLLSQLARTDTCISVGREGG
jgi:hypothetical protein